MGTDRQGCPVAGFHERVATTGIPPSGAVQCTEEQPVSHARPKFHVARYPR